MSDSDAPKGHVTLRLPAALAIALATALGSAGAVHVFSGAPQTDVSAVLVKVERLDVKVEGMREVQAQILARLNNDKDAASNAALIAQLRAALGKPAQ